LYPAVAVYEVCFIDKKAKGVNFATGVVSRVIHTVGLEMNYCFVLYVLLKFVMPFKDSDGNYVKNSWTVIVSYVTSPNGALIDVVALVAGFTSEFQGTSASTGNDSLDRYTHLFVLLWLVRDLVL